MVDQLPDRVVEATHLRLFHHLPDARLAMDSVEAGAVAALAEGNAGVGAVLLDVMRFRVAFRATDCAGHGLDNAQVIALLLGQCVVHSGAFASCIQ